VLDRELLAPATAAPNVQIWVFNGVIVIKPASMQLGGDARAIQGRDSATHRYYRPGRPSPGCPVTMWRDDDRSVRPPATGKTTLALGRALAVPVFSRDPVMAVL
jgi:hypothetical protein